MAGNVRIFPLILFVAFCLSVVLTLAQHKAYQQELNRALRVPEADDPMCILISGRSRTWRGGAVIVAIINTVDKRIVYASVMKGISVFARFKPYPSLLGPIDQVENKMTDKRLVKAWTMAHAQIVSQQRHVVRRRMSSTTQSTYQAR